MPAPQEAGRPPTLPLEQSRPSGRLCELVVAAAGLDPGEREDYLARRAGDDPELQAAARRRLELADAMPDSFLSAPVPSSAGGGEAETAGVLPALLAGWERYEVGELLGSGGMGEVYKAFDRRLKRPVALKFLRRADRETSRRFLREAEAQAQVDHQHVLPVHETGEVDGRPYIALRYVDGRGLMEVRDETTTEEKARLLAWVAEGLHAAHRQGLVHRDVKPSNILVEHTDGGRLHSWVMDFGVARPLQGPELTATGVVLGTPHYMAPEQLNPRAGVDRRTDVYGLGATMYHFLAGAVPLPADGALEVLRRVVDDDPRPLRAVCPGLPAELEAIVMKCLEKDPERRYPSCRAVADDLWRFLDGKPVAARTSTLAYRLSKKLVRHRAVASVVAAAVLALVAVLLVFSVKTAAQARRIAREAERAERAAERAERQAAAARRVSGFLVELFRVSEPGTARGNTITAREILDRGAERVEHELADQPLVRAELMDTIGTVYLELGLYEPAAYLLEQALKTARGELGDEHLEVAAMMGGLAGLYRRGGELERAEPLFRQALGVLEASPRAPPAGLGATLDHLAELHADRGDFERAEALLRRGLDLKEGALGPGNPEVARDRIRLARLYADTGDLERAEDLYRRSLASLEQVHGFDHPEVARAEGGLGAVLFATGDLEEAAEHLHRAVSTFERLVPEGGEVAGLRAELTRLQLAGGDLAQGLAYGRRAVTEADRWAAANPSSRAGSWRLAAALAAYGEALAAVGDRSRAGEGWQRGLEAIEAMGPVEGVVALDLRARLLLRLGRVDAARPLVEDLLARGWRRPPLPALSREAGLY